MQAFIQVNLENKTAFSYRRPLLLWLNDRAPGLVVLDIDSFSEEMLVSQAGRLIGEAVTYAVYFKVSESNAPLGAAFKLVEEVIREDKPGLILLEGTHTRLSTIVQARPHLLLKNVTSLEEIKQHLVAYFSFPNQSA